MSAREDDDNNEEGISNDNNVSDDAQAARRVMMDVFEQDRELKARQKKAKSGTTPRSHCENTVNTTTTPPNVLRDAFEEDLEATKCQKGLRTARPTGGGSSPMPGAFATNTTNSSSSTTLSDIPSFRGLRRNVGKRKSTMTSGATQEDSFVIDEANAALESSLQGTQQQQQQQQEFSDIGERQVRSAQESFQVQPTPPTEEGINDQQYNHHQQDSSAVPGHFREMTSDFSEDDPNFQSMPPPDDERDVVPPPQQYSPSIDTDEFLVQAELVRSSRFFPIDNDNNVSTNTAAAEVFIADAEVVGFGGLLKHHRGLRRFLITLFAVIVVVIIIVVTILMTVRDRVAHAASSSSANATTPTTTTSAVSPGTCLMLYEMATSLDDFASDSSYQPIHQELAKSQLIQNPNVKAWVYYHNATAISANNPNATAMFSIVEGSTAEYITWDNSNNNNNTKDNMMTVLGLPATTNDEEEEKDSIQQFLEYAMKDCQESNHSSLMAILSSDTRFYSGSDNRRRLYSYDVAEQVAASIQKALVTVFGAETKLDVLGFDDVNQMQRLDVMDRYQNVSHHLLASEATQPGHGWDYSALSDGFDALRLAEDLVTTFVDGTHGGVYHKVPKQLSIVATSKVEHFNNAMEAFFAELLNLTKTDHIMNSFLSRARASSVAYDTNFDSTIGRSRYASGLDIGSFLDTFREICVPDATSPLSTFLEEALAAYLEMIVVQGVGPGSPSGTGAHFVWPTQFDFSRNADAWEELLFETGTHTVSSYRAFLQYFLVNSTTTASNTLVDVDGDAETLISICTAHVSTADSDDHQQDLDGLIYGTSLTIQDSDGGGSVVTLSSEVASSVTEVSVQYGMDLTSTFQSATEEKGYNTTADEYMHIFGGDVYGTYDGSSFAAEWDYHFYFLNVSGMMFDSLYVMDAGDDSKKIRAFYFPEEHSEAISELLFLDYLFFDFDYWLSLGGRYSYVQFSSSEATSTDKSSSNGNDEESDDDDDDDNDKGAPRFYKNLNLYTSNDKGAVTEVPPERGGYWFPLIYVDAYFQGLKLTELVGGLGGTVIPWSSDLDYSVVRVRADRIPVEMDALFVTVTASTNNGVASAVNDKNNTESRNFEWWS